ncbi:MAG TPA: 50S ribosomal protein L10 [Actinomycetota bacterium]|nr:50S ribosomal protein L10 [Actinomycetota bacterium]
MPDTYEVKVRPEKVEAIAKIRDSLERAGAIVLTEYRGLTVGELAELRTKLAESEVEYRVVKNTLTARAAAEIGIEGLDGLLEGPTAVAFLYGDPVSGTKALTTFADDHPALVVKGGLLERRLMSKEETQALAKVDPLDVSLAKICGSLQSPLAAIAATLEAPLGRIVYVLEQLAARGE